MRLSSARTMSASVSPARFRIPFSSPEPKNAQKLGAFETVGFIEGIKVLKGLNGKHGLPESSHSSNAYIKLKPDGTFHEMRIYDNNHTLCIEIAYHPEKSLTGNNHTPVLHYHIYDERFSRNSTGAFMRSPAICLPEVMKRTYKKYFRGIKL